LEVAGKEKWGVIYIMTRELCGILCLYTDYLTVTFGYATATGLSELLDGQISHDAISRFLSEREYTSKDLWKQVKKTARDVQSDQGVLIFDDTVQEKPHMDENDLICCISLYTNQTFPHSEAI
jgi:hypothetical protein